MSETLQPAVFRDDSDAGFQENGLVGPWTIDQVRKRALSLGKQFAPNANVTNRLAANLSNQEVVVLFTTDDVEEAIALGYLPENQRSYLLNLVSQEGLNDIAVILAQAVENDLRDQLLNWFLTNNRC